MEGRVRHIKSLDGLRGFAVLAVLWSHFLPIEGMYISKVFFGLGDFLGAGYFGVDLFFVLSGFLITRIMLQERAEGFFSLKFFYVKRFFRIFPIFYISILVSYLIFELSAEEVFSNIFYLSNYYYVFNDHASPLRHTWSLSVEEQFYLIWPFLFVFLGVSNFKKVVYFYVPCVAVGSAIFALWYFDGDDGIKFVYRSVTCRMLSLSLGARLAFIERDNRIADVKPIAWIVLSATILLLAYASSEYASGTVSAFLKMIGFSAFSYGLVSMCVSEKWFLINKCFSHVGLTYIGRISYGLYLYHAIIIYGLEVSKFHVSEADPLRWLLGIVLSFLFAVVSYEFFEKKVVKLRKYFSPR